MSLLTVMIMMMTRDQVVQRVFEYQGEFSKNLRHGYGICVWADGSRYEGDWSNDDRYDVEPRG